QGRHRGSTELGTSSRSPAPAQRWRNLAGGHFTVPYFVHMLRGLRTGLPSYVTDSVQGVPSDWIWDHIDGIMISYLSLEVAVDMSDGWRALSAYREQHNERY